MTEQIVSSAPLTVASVPYPAAARHSAAWITTASEFVLDPGGVLIQAIFVSVASTFAASSVTNDCWVWDGSQEIPASVFVWDGAAEAPAALEVV